jgi:trk system potassium uptake protein TrkH
MILEGFFFIIPIIFAFFTGESNQIKYFLIPAFLSIILGYIFIKFFNEGKIYFIESLLICGVSWIILAIFAGLPFTLSSGESFIDGYFEAVSGLTTTGITIFTNIESLSKSVILWRSMIQWFGGLGILTLFLAITFKSNNAYFRLFSAESHKIDSARPTPSIFKTVIILWSIYGLFTITEAILLKTFGMNLFDAINHSLTTLSTGGFSPYDSSIQHFKNSGYHYYKEIEYIITFFMFLGGVNFLLHYKALTGKIKSIFKDIEFKVFLFIILSSTILILSNHYIDISRFSLHSLEKDFRHTIFTVISITTTTGFGTTDINSSFFPAMAKQIILILMLIGGSVGSTAGGIKVLRITVLVKLFKKEIQRLRLPKKAISKLVINKRIFPVSEIKRITSLFFGWLLLIFIGAMITAAFSDLSAWQSFSGMFSAVGNIGPFYFSVEMMSKLPDIVKLTYIFGMLAGRLEILPVLLIFSRKAWKNS